MGTYHHNHSHHPSCQMHRDKSPHSHCSHTYHRHHNHLQSHHHLGDCTHQSQSWAYKRKGTVINGGKISRGFTIPLALATQGEGIILHQITLAKTLDKPIGTEIHLIIPYSG